MIINIPFGRWLLPLAITIAVVIWTVRDGRRETGQNPGGMFNMDPLVWAIYSLRGLAVVLGVWLIWALLA